MPHGKTSTIDIFALARTGGSTAGVVPTARLQRFAGSLRDAGGDLSYTLRGYVDDRARPSVELSLRATVALTCDRCSRPLVWEIDERRRFYLVGSAAELNAAPIDEQEEDALLGSRHFDLMELVEDESILSLPISPRHEQCTASALRESPEAAADEPETRRPFAVLSGLKVRKH